MQMEEEEAEEEEEMDWGGEDEGDEDALFEMLLQQQIEANKQQAAISQHTISQVLDRVKSRQDEAQQAKREREDGKAERLEDWSVLKASVLSKIAICIKWNEQCTIASSSGTEVHPPSFVASVTAMQKFLGQFRSEFRQVPSNTDGAALADVVALLQSKQGTEMQLCQLLVGTARLRLRVPTRLVIRIANDKFCEERDVWVEFYLENLWHRAFASVARVIREEEEFKKQKCALPFGKLDSRPMYLKSGAAQSKTLLVLAVGECNHLTIVTKRYVPIPRQRLDEFARQVCLDWNQAIISTASTREDSSNYYSHTWTRQALEAERAFLERSYQMPTTRAEFSKPNGEFVLQSDLNAFRFVKPGERPIDFFKGEPVYRRRDQIMELLTEFMWRKRGRRVMEGEEPIKIVQRQQQQHQSGRSHALRLFSEEQTEEMDFGQVLEDGTIPINEFGNVEAWGVPVGAVHLRMDGAREACERLGIKFVDCVVGFERNTQYHNGFKAKPKFEGVVVAADNQVLVQAQIEQLAREREEGKTRAQREANLREWRRLLEANWTVATSNLGKLMMMEEEEQQQGRM